MKPAAPSRTISSRVTPNERYSPDISRTRFADFAARIAFIASTPFIRGIAMSMTTRSGCKSFASDTASTPSWPLPTISWPAYSIVSATTSHTAVWSSTTNTRSFLVSCGIPVPPCEAAVSMSIECSFGARNLPVPILHCNPRVCPPLPPTRPIENLTFQTQCLPSRAPCSILPAVLRSPHGRLI